MPTPTPTPFVANVLTSGSFQGADDFHFGEGTAAIIEVAPGRFVLRFDAFSVRNGPDLYVYLSPDSAGYAGGVLELGMLKATDGSFSYELPAGTNPSTFASAVIWCKQFSVQFAVAAFGGA
jgi:electron transfer DM13